MEVIVKQKKQRKKSVQPNLYEQKIAEVSGTEHKSRKKVLIM